MSERKKSIIEMHNDIGYGFGSEVIGETAEQRSEILSKIAKFGLSAEFEKIAAEGGGFTGPQLVEPESPPKTS